jgi:serine/threonine protein kinase
VATKSEYCLGICRGLKYLHLQNVIHRDLKPQNILLDAHWIAKIADFGLSKDVDASASARMTTGSVGTPLYVAPEITLGEEHYTYSCDIFSLGLVLYELLVDKEVYYHVKNKTQIQVKIATNQDLRPIFDIFEQSKNMKVAAQQQIWIDVIESAWQHEAENRISLTDILSRMETND